MADFAFSHPLRRRATKELLSILAEYPNGLPTLALMRMRRFTKHKTLTIGNVIGLLRTSGQVYERHHELAGKRHIWWRLKNIPAEARLRPSTAADGEEKSMETLLEAIASSGQWISDWIDRNRDVPRLLRLSKEAQALGLRLIRSAAHRLAPGNQLGYKIIDPISRATLAGQSYELDLDDVEIWLYHYAQHVLHNELHQV
jgi:hypothetical protein